MTEEDVERVARIIERECAGGNSYNPEENFRNAARAVLLNLASGYDRRALIDTVLRGDPA